MHPSSVTPEAREPLEQFESAPPRFAAALHSLQHVAPRPEIELDEVPAPLRTAPYAVAIEGSIAADADAAADEDFDAFGRIIILYDPEGQAGWHGEFRVVTTIKASLSPELNAEPLLTEVAWSWLTDALAGLEIRGLSGTVTQIKSSSFGEIADDERDSIEIRASWSPGDDNLGSNFAAWMQVLASAAGLEPTDADVTPINAAHGSGTGGGHHGHHASHVRNRPRPALV